MQLFGRLTDLLHAESTRLRNWNFLEAAMAAGALAACPEGRVSLARRVALDRVLSSLEELKAFEVHEAVKLFDSYADRIREDPEQGRSRALRAVTSLADDQAAAEVVMQAVSVVSQADGGHTVRDVAQLSEISKALGLPSPNVDIEDLRPPVETPTRAPERPRPHVITIGNTKGGTGKSTIAVHLTVALLKMGFKVGTIDLDAGQGTLSRYFENRFDSNEARSGDLPMPATQSVQSVTSTGKQTAEALENARLREAFAELSGCDYVILDTPGSESHLSRLGHFNADTLITPVNDSFIDIDVLARINRVKREVIAPSDYCRMVWELRDRRRAESLGDPDWIVLRNRLAHVDARNSRNVAQLLEQLSGRIGFRLCHGLSERVVLRALFEHGLTLLDLKEDDPEIRNPASHARACEEIRDLVEALGLTAKQERKIAAAG